MKTDTPIEVANLCLSGVKGYNEMNGRIYSPEGIATTVRANSGGHNELKIAEPICLNSKGDDGKQPSLHNRIYDSEGIATACTTAPFFMPAYQVENTEQKIAIPQATKRGYIECELGGVVDLSYPNSKTRRGRVQEGGTVSPTITAESNGLCVIEPNIRVRKLTPKECWRLMGFDDDSFYRAKYSPECPTDLAKRIEKRDLTKKEWKRLYRYTRREYVSNSQLYKQAGNSIVVDVLMAIFKEML